MLLLRNCTGEVVVQATSIPNSELPGPAQESLLPSRASLPQQEVVKF